MTEQNVKTDAELDGVPGSEGIDEKAEDAPVYDSRGNVRPRGTKDARRMTFEERAEIAQRLAKGESPESFEETEEDEPEPVSTEKVKPLQKSAQSKPSKKSNRKRK